MAKNGVLIRHFDRQSLYTRLVDEMIPKGVYGAKRTPPTAGWSRRKSLWNWVSQKGGRASSNEQPAQQDEWRKACRPQKKNLLDDRRVRLALSVLGAIVAWMVVTIIVQPGTTNTIYNVPVDYTYDSAAYTSRGLSIVSAEDKTVNLKLSGDGYTIGGLSASGLCGLPGLVQRARQRRKRPCGCWCAAQTVCSMA